MEEKESLLSSIAPLEKDNPLPLYYRIMEQLREEIKRGHWNVDDKIPSEAELCDLFGVSRAVVRQALNELENDGLVIKKQGKGTYVARPRETSHLAQELLGFYEEMAKRGTPPISKVLRQKVEPASYTVAEQLKVIPGSEVIVIERVRYVNNEPILLVTSFLPFNLCSSILDTDLRTNSVYGYLENDLGLKPSYGRRIIQAVSANKQHALLLQVDEGDPLISFDGITYLADGRPIEWYHSVFRSDRLKFEVRLIRNP
jgi:GntR family transcriptional regulator